MIRLTQQDHINILTMDGAEGNSIDLEFLAALHESLDAVEAAADGPAALLITGSGKAFSVGLNVATLMGYQPEQMTTFDTEVRRLYGRLVNFPLPTIAAVNGHAFAAGAYLALACDYRVMREDRGWFCISEVDVGVPIHPDVQAMAQAKLAPQVLRDAVLQGKRFVGPECVDLGIADAACSEESLIATAIELIAALSIKERTIFTTLKSTLYARYATALGATENTVKSKAGALQI
ncbi:MAG: enoyl-CoA hydratase/isomerase family protein [Halieaceae bacterium]|jgi:Delta3-Delta2-enoyl-CoA isomerase|nr:enoyl-CoA hydratase/isomerase family protein [Halieaceae bacterium]